MIVKVLGALVSWVCLVYVDDERLRFSVAEKLGGSIGGTAGKETICGRSQGSLHDRRRIGTGKFTLRPSYGITQIVSRVCLVLPRGQKPWAS